ncbi:MAG: hypothetical protein IPP07_25805 [Holophagales bacterium]|nr:hypothetical protein [Holophagales bacterium]
MPTPGDGAAIHVSPDLRQAPRPPAQSVPDESTATVVGKATGDGSVTSLHVRVAELFQSDSPVAAQTSLPKSAREETG